MSLFAHVGSESIYSFLDSGLNAFRKEAEREVLEELATKWLPHMKLADNITSQFQTAQNMGVDDCIRHIFSMIKERTK